MNNAKNTKKTDNKPRNSNASKPNSNTTLTKQVSNAYEKTKEIGEKVKEGAINIKDNVSEKVTEKVKDVKNNVATDAKVTSLATAGLMVKNFTDSNTAITKFVFIVLVFLLFITLFNFGVQLLQKWVGNSPDPFIINGMVLSNNTRVVSSNPNEEDSVPILRSINEEYGLEFTWNVWFYVDKLNKDNTSYQRIFSKGSNESSTTGVTPFLKDNVKEKILNASPGLFITQQDNSSILPSRQESKTTQSNVNLYFVVNTFKNKESNQQYAETITIHNVPVKKWVCVTMRVEHKTADIYINGVLTQRKTFTNLPRQNYYDTIVGDTNGFTGFISALRYYSHALNYEEIQNVFGKGPNLKSIDTSTGGILDYLSLNWYLKP
jgi:hypothetical protein